MSLQVVSWNRDYYTLIDEDNARWVLDYETYLFFKTPDNNIYDRLTYLFEGVRRVDESTYAVSNPHRPLIEEDIFWYGSSTDKPVQLLYPYQATTASGNIMYVSWNKDSLEVVISNKQYIITPDRSKISDKINIIISDNYRENIMELIESNCISHIIGFGISDNLTNKIPGEWIFDDINTIDLKRWLQITEPYHLSYKIEYFSHRYNLYLLPLIIQIKRLAEIKQLFPKIYNQCNSLGLEIETFLSKNHMVYKNIVEVDYQIVPGIYMDVKISPLGTKLEESDRIIYADENRVYYYCSTTEEDDSSIISPVLILLDKDKYIVFGSGNIVCKSENLSNLDDSILLEYASAVYHNKAPNYTKHDLETEEFIRKIHTLTIYSS